MFGGRLPGPPVVDGWTQFTATEPSGEGTDHVGAGTRKVYVDATSGSDANKGTQASPKQTLSAGYAALRSGSPDWLLLKCGETWSESFPQWKIPGKNASEPMLLSTYGSGARPIIKATLGTICLNFTGSGGGSNGGRYLAVVGLDFYCDIHDPDSVNYVAADTTSGGIKNFNDLVWFLVEDCRFRFSGIQMQHNTSGGLYISRRNIHLDAYSELDRVQGTYVAYTGRIVMEENFYDHNGWHDTIVGAEQNIFSHNVYLSAMNGQCDFIKNISARGSSHGAQIRPGGYVFNNLLVQNGVGLYGAASPPAELHSTNFNHSGTFLTRVHDNVITECRAIDGSGGRWGLATGATGEFPNAHAVANDGPIEIKRNLVCNNLNIAAGFGISVDTAMIPGTVTIADNVVFFAANNGIYDPSSIATLTNNKVDANGDNAEYSFSDPSRSVARYNNEVLGGAATLQAFLDRHRSRGRGVWNENEAAPAVNNWIRAGFDMAAVA